MSDPYDIDPMAQAEAEQEILKLNRLLSRITEEYAAAAIAHAKATVAYDLARATAWPDIPRYDGGGEKLLAAEREAQLLLTVAAEYEQMELSKAVEKQLSKRSTNILGQLSALQTINANIRHAVTHSSGRGG